jgi:hypothetical protein
MNLRVTETSDWAAIEQAALAAGTCIRPDGINNSRAKETFEAGGVRYFLQESRNPVYQWDTIGYIRLHRVSESTSTPLWVVDFASPFIYRSIRMVQQQLEAPLLVHKRSVDDDDLAEHWPMLSLTLSKATDYQFHQCQSGYESKWLLVS